MRSMIILKKSLIVMYIIIYNCVNIDIAIYQKNIINLKYKGVEQTIAT
jgi:hypothetical protein